MFSDFCFYLIKFIGISFKDMAGIVVNTEEYKILVTTVKTTNLVDTLGADFFDALHRLRKFNYLITIYLTYDCHS